MWETTISEDFARSRFDDRTIGVWMGAGGRALRTRISIVECGAPGDEWGAQDVMSGPPANIITRGSSMMDLEIRQAQVADAIQIADCLTAAFAPFRHLYTSDAFADTVPAADAVRDRIERMTVWVAVAPVGLVAGTLAAACSDQEGHLRGMAVRPEWQGRGIARRLLMAAEHHLMKSGCRRITLDTTDPLTKAICLYESCGFVRSGRVEDYFGMPLYEFVKQLPATEDIGL